MAADCVICILALCVCRCVCVGVSVCAVSFFAVDDSTSCCIVGQCPKNSCLLGELSFKWKVPHFIKYNAMGNQ